MPSTEAGRDRCRWLCWHTANFKSGSQGKGKTSLLLAKLSQSNAVFRLREEAAREHTQSLFWILGINFIWSHGLYKRRARDLTQVSPASAWDTQGGGAGDPLRTEPSPSGHAAHMAKGPGLDHFSSNSSQKRITSVFWNCSLSCPQHQLELAFKVLFLV